jgi:hypothetical protein
MSWSTPAELRAQVQRLWDRGDILAGLVSGETPFPRRLVLRRPTAAELLDRFDEARAWIGELRRLRHCRVELREVGHRVLGPNALPREVWVDTFEDAVALIGRQREVAHFRQLVELTRAREPRLLEWVAQRPLRALQLADEWVRLLGIVAWLTTNPLPGIYLRQVDLPGVHTKFIEAHRGVLIELLDRVLPPEAIDQSISGVSQFARRYGFRDKPERIRFRILDPRHALLPGSEIHDITLDAPSFAALERRVPRVLITENEINFLALPPLRDTMVIFGAGYGFETLGRTRWLADRRIHYWGDIDTHGFAILDQLRGQLGQVESFLMDRATLLAFESHWGVEEKPTCRDLPRLTAEERALYDDLRDNRIRNNVRLEQERIGFGWVKTALAKLEEPTRLHTGRAQ